MFYNFDWTDSILKLEAKEAVEARLVEFRDNFEQHRFAIAINIDFKVQLTPSVNKPCYNQSLPAPIHVRGDILMKLPYYQGMESPQHNFLANMLVQYSQKGNEMGSCTYWLTSEK